MPSGTDETVTAKAAPAVAATQSANPSETTTSAQPSAPEISATGSQIAVPSRIDLWSTRLAAWSQVLTVAVLIFGYFYTVRPAFQLGLLQEQTAHLQIANEAAENKLAQTVAAQSQATAKLDALNADFARVAKNRDELATQLRQESIREAEAQRKMSGVQTQLSTQAGSLLIAQRRLFYSRFSSAIFLRFSSPAVYPNDDDADGAFILKAKASWPNPELQISQVIDGLEKSNAAYHEYPPEFLAPLRRIAEQKKADLTCEAVDLEPLREAYKTAYSRIDEVANKEADDNLEKQVQDARAKHTRLLGVEEARPSYRRVARIGHLYSLQREYGGRVNALLEACEAKTQPVIKLMEQQILSGS